MKVKAFVAQWELFDDEVAQKTWNRNLTHFDEFTYFQSYEWGEHRRGFGWTPMRWVAYNEEREIVSMAQALYRSYGFGIGAVWASGGPVGDISTWGEGFRRVAMKSTGARFLYYRIFANRKATQEDCNVLESLGWVRCAGKLRSGLSAKLRLDRDMDAVHREMSGNWKRNLRRASKRDLTVEEWIEPDIEEMSALYGSMENYKGIDEQFSRAELESIFRNLKDHIVLYRCESSEGRLVALRGCLVLGRKAWDLFAATDVPGRKIYASYSLLWRIFDHCQQIGVQEYDLMGIDPAANPGVSNFKQGTGAEFVEYLGEWEWCSNRFIKWGANIAARRVRRNNA